MYKTCLYRSDLSLSKNTNKFSNFMVRCEQSKTIRQYYHYSYLMAKYVLLLALALVTIVASDCPLNPNNL